MPAATIYPTGFTSVVGDNAIVISTGEPSSAIRLQNNTATPVYLAYDTPASQGSLAVAAGELWSDDAPFGKGLVSTLHLYTPSSVSINGTSTGGICLWAVN